MAAIVFVVCHAYAQLRDSVCISVRPMMDEMVYGRRIRKTSPTITLQHELYLCIYSYHGAFVCEQSPFEV